MGRKDVKIVSFTIDKRCANGKKEEKQFYCPLPTITKMGMYDLALENGVVIQQIYGTGIVKSVSTPSNRNI